MDRSSKQNINKDIAALNNAIDQMDLRYIYIEPYIPKKQNTFFSNAHGTFWKIDHIIGNKTSLNKFKDNWNHIKHFPRPQGTETRNQPQGKKLKKIQIHGDLIACY